MNEACGGGERRQTSGAPTASGRRQGQQPQTNFSFSRCARRKVVGWLTAGVMAGRQAHLISSILKENCCLAPPSTNERFSICWLEWAAGEEKKSIKWSCLHSFKRMPLHWLTFLPFIPLPPAAKSNSTNQPFFNWLIDGSCCCLSLFLPSLVGLIKERRSGL